MGCIERGYAVVGMCRERVWSLWVCVERGYGVYGYV